MIEQSGPVCSKCGFDFGGAARQGRRCPQCGAEERVFSVGMGTSANGLASMQGKHRRPGFPGFVTDFLIITFVTFCYLCDQIAPRSGGRSFLAGVDYNFA